MNMKKTTINIFLLASALFYSFTSFSQWQQAAGTAGLNIQSLITNGMYNFAGGSTGAYLSTDNGANYILSNNGNDAVGLHEALQKITTTFILVQVKEYSEVQITEQHGCQQVQVFPTY